MLCTLRDARQRSGETGLHLLHATDLADRLTDILTEHRIVFEKKHRRNLIAIVGPQNHARIVTLLRHLLSESERRAVSVFAGDGSEFPTPRLLDEWWRVYETAWFGRALAEDRFVTWFQPVVDTAAQRVLGHECLIRLPDARHYSTGEILDAAWVRDESRAFDAYARDLAIRSAAKQSKDSTFFMSFMPSSIGNPALCLSALLQTLREAGLQPSNIVLEVAEPELVRDRVPLRICDLYRDHGFRLALDDVGRSPDSLRLPGDLRPDFIKLHKTLVQDVERPLYASTIHRLVELSDRFNVTVVAKGMEQSRIMEDLWLLGVQCMQGHLFGRPGPQLPNLIAASRPASPALAVN
jgi:EAL domain-containing protein (putative c-di-GMP-specific phosphodiesterase class I)